MGSIRTEILHAPDDEADFLIELDEDLTAPTPLPLTARGPDADLSAIDALDSFAAGDHAPPEPTDLIFIPEMERQAHTDPELLADIQRAKDAGVSLASSRIEQLPDSPQALLSFNDGRHVPVTKSVTIIGRSKEVADIVLDSDKVSRQHAAIIFARGEFFIEDLDSTNGTLIYGKRIKRVRLAPGLNVRIGGFELRLGFGD